MPTSQKAVITRHYSSLRSSTLPVLSFPSLPETGPPSTSSPSYLQGHFSISPPLIAPGKEGMDGKKAL